MRNSAPPAQAGFTLIELMIAMAISLIITGAAISLAVNISRAATDTTIYTRTNQDMRTTMALITRELKRAGFNQSSLNQIGTGVSTAPYSTMPSNAVANIATCVMYGYDTLDVGNGASDSTPGEISDTAEPNEWRGFRRQVVDGVGVVQMRLGGTGAGTGCDGGGHVWTNLTDPATLDVTALTFDFSNAHEAVAGTVNDPSVVPPAAPRSMVALVGVRPILITLRGRSPAAPDNVRELRQWIRTRADSLRLVPVPPRP